MSRVMWDRIHRLQIAVPPEVKNDVDDEFEKVTNKECDEAATKLSDLEFREAMQKALAAIRARKEKKKQMVEVAA